MSKTQDIAAELEKEGFGVVSPRIVAFAVIEHLFQFFRQTEIHDPTNQIFKRCLDNICRSLKNLESLPGFESLEISFRGEQIYINKLRMRPHFRQFRQTRHLVRYVRKRKIGVIKLPNQVDPNAVRDFLWAIAQVDPKDADPVQTVRNQILEKKLVGCDVEALKIGQLNSLDPDGNLSDADLVGLLLHEKIRKNLEIYFDNLERSVEFKLTSFKDLIGDLVNLEEEDLLQIFRCHLFKRHEKPLALMGADSAFALVAWGRSIGLPAGVLMDLAKIGMAYPLVYLVRKEIRLDPLTGGEMRELLTIMERLKAVWPFSELDKLCVMEWTQPFGPDGVYSRDGSNCYAHFFSRMLRVVAKFKYWTQNRPGFDSFLPDEAMAQLIKEEADLDPTLLKLFVNWLGIYPVGTLVELHSGELAQVFAAGSDPTRFQRPVVSVIRDGDGKILDRPYLVDLMDMNEKLGIYRKSIRKSLAPEEVKLPEDIFRRVPLSLS